MVCTPLISLSFCSTKKNKIAIKVLPLAYQKEKEKDPDLSLDHFLIQWFALCTNQIYFFICIWLQGVSPVVQRD